ncbi:hypothetical protein SCYAM73S_01349 [Streptomyces cyaneofuscatus]
MKSSAAFFASLEASRHALAMSRNSSSSTPGVFSWMRPSLNPSSTTGFMMNMRKSGISPRIPEAAHEWWYSPSPRHVRSFGGPYLGTVAITAGGCFSSGGSPLPFLAAQSACA